MEKIEDRVYRLSSGHILEVVLPPISKVFQLLSRLSKSFKDLDIDSLIKKMLANKDDEGNIDFLNLDLNTVKDLVISILAQDELLIDITNLMSTSLLDKKPCSFENEENRVDLIEAVYIYLKEVFTPFLKNLISRSATLVGVQGKK